MLCDKKHSHVQWRDFKMNVLVCDDDQQIVDSIIEELKKKSEETQVALRFYGFSQPSQINLSLPYDIALLDIDMGETNGIELARKCFLFKCFNDRINDLPFIVTNQDIHFEIPPLHMCTWDRFSLHNIQPCSLQV